VHPQVHERAYRNTPVTELQKAANRVKPSVRTRAEHVYGHMETAMGGLMIHTIGLARAKLKVTFTNLAYNRLPQKLDFVCQMLGVRPRINASVLRGTCGLKEAHNDADGRQNWGSGEVYYAALRLPHITTTTGAVCLKCKNEPEITPPLPIRRASKQQNPPTEKCYAKLKRKSG
jgi:Transposase DDE domain